MRFFAGMMVSIFERQHCSFSAKLRHIFLSHQDPDIIGSLDRWMTGTQNHEGLAGVTAAVDYLAAKSIELRFLDREKGREKGMSQFLDEKTYRPGIQPSNRPTEKAS